MPYAQELSGVLEKIGSKYASINLTDETTGKKHDILCEVWKMKDAGLQPGDSFKCTLNGFGVINKVIKA